MTPGKRVSLVRVLRVALGIGLLALIIWQFAGWRDVWHLLLNIQFIYLPAAIALYFVGVWISCLKWQWLLRVHGESATIGQLFNWYLLGAFANNVLPSDIGGDLGRGYIAGRTLGNQLVAWSSVVAERLTGVLGLFVWSALVLLAAPALLGWSPLLPMALFGCAVLGLVLIGVALRSGVLRASWVPARVTQSIEKVQQVLERYQHNPGVLAGCLALSMVFHVLGMIALWLYILAVDPTATRWQAALVSPLVSLIGLLPLTPGGLGVREGAMVVLLERSGISAEHAVVVALLGRAVLFVVSFSGFVPMLHELRATGTSTVPDTERES